ncbi:MAG: DoxX family protein [Chitinophagaceae bacterium]|nr:DoxX family protein [Chitinophagaceae bacterium]
MKDHTISRIAIYILSIVMIIFGIDHFRHPRIYLVYVPNFLPGGIVWVYIVGVAFILAAVAFIFKRFVKVAAYLLAAMLLVFVLFIHVPNFLHAGDAEMRQLAFVNLLKDTALAAFALHIASNARTVD